MGRPSKLNERVIRTLCESARIGMKRKHQSDRAGIDVSTLHAWIAGGKQGKPKYSEFFERYKKAEADGIAHMLALVIRAAKEDRTWQASAWILERCHGYNRQLEPEEITLLSDIKDIHIEGLSKIKEQLRKADSLVKSLEGPTIDLDD